MTSTWSPSAKCLHYSSSSFFTTLFHPVTHFFLKCPTFSSPLSVTWSPISPSLFRQFCWPHLISQWQIHVEQFNQFLHYALSPTEKRFLQSPETFSSHLILTDKLLRHSYDTFFTTLVYQWRMTPSLFRHFLHTSFPITVPTLFPHTWNGSGEYLHKKSGTLIHHAWSASDKRHHHIPDASLENSFSPVSLSWPNEHERSYTFCVILTHNFW